MEIPTLGIHQSTSDADFQHPIARNLQWHDVRSMLGSLAETTEEPNGNTKFSRNGQTLTVHPSRHKDVSDIEEMMQIRHFLERSAPPATPTTAPADAHILVVIDHREARIFQTELQNAIPARIVPLGPTGRFIATTSTPSTMTTTALACPNSNRSTTPSPKPSPAPKKSSSSAPPPAPAAP